MYRFSAAQSCSNSGKKVTSAGAQAREKMNNTKINKSSNSFFKHHRAPSDPCICSGTGFIPDNFPDATLITVAEPGTSTMSVPCCAPHGWEFSH